LIFAYGKLLPDEERPALLDRLEEELGRMRTGTPLTPERVVAAVDALGRRMDAGEFDAMLARYLPPGVRRDALRGLLSREALESKLLAELGTDPFAPVDHGRSVARRFPLGVLLHIAPSNQPGLPVYSVLEGLLTGNVNLLKLPHADKGLSLAALSLLVEAQPELAGYIYAFDLSSRETGVLERLSRLSDGVVTWGSDAAVEAVRRLAPPGCKLVEWGHRLSFAYVAGWEDRAGELAALAGHIVSTGQRLCSSCQVIFLDTDDFSRVCGFSEAFLPVLERAAANRPAGPAGAALSSLNGLTALLERTVDGTCRGERVFQGRGCCVIARPDRELELSPMEANVFVKPLPRDRMIPALSRHRGRLQTAALLCGLEDRAELAGMLARAGLTRITRAGTLSESFPGEGHDGEYPLLRYTRVVDVEK